MKKLSLHRAGLGIFVGLALTGCGAVDSFEPRALQYNQEAANAKSNTILLNILRSAHRLPLQFTEYTTTVGQASLSGQLGASLPVATIPSNIAKTFGLNPQISGTAQNQITIQNLNNQEFYYGLQTPLSQQMLATFLGVGYDPEVVFLLAVSTLKRTSALRTDRLDNDASDPIKLARFYDAVKLLLLAGMSFETTQGATRSIGPIMSANEAKNFLPHYINAAATAAAGNASNSLPDFKQKGSSYQLTKASSVFRICFRKEKLDELIAYKGSRISVSMVGNDYLLNLQLASTRKPIDLYTMRLVASRLCGATLAPVEPKHDGILVDWDFDLRSVEAIYNYLGRMVRAGWNDPENYENAYQLPRDFGGYPFFLFRVHNGFAHGSVFTATLGATYSILPMTPDDRDKSTQVIGLLTDLWALQSSAKSFPATSTVSVTTQ